MKLNSNSASQLDLNTLFLDIATPTRPHHVVNEDRCVLAVLASGWYNAENSAR